MAPAAPQRRRAQARHRRRRGEAIQARRPLRRRGPDPRDPPGSLRLRLRHGAQILRLRRHRLRDQGVRRLPGAHPPAHGPPHPRPPPPRRVRAGAGRRPAAPGRSGLRRHGPHLAPRLPPPLREPDRHRAELPLHRPPRLHPHRRGRGRRARLRPLPHRGPAVLLSGQRIGGRSNAGLRYRGATMRDAFTAKREEAGRPEVSGGEAS